VNLKELFARLCSGQPAWLPGADGILLFGRLRVSLNLRGLVFPERMGGEERVQLLEMLLARPEVCADLALRCELDRPVEEEWEFLSERWVLEPCRLPVGGCEILLATDESLSLLINGEDHLRYQGLGSVESLLMLLADLERRAEALQQNPGLALNATGARQVSSPFLCGSGTLVTLVLHLPGLSWWGRIEELLDPLYNEGICYRTWQEGFGDFLVLENLSAQEDHRPAQTLDQVIRQLEPIGEAEGEARRELLLHRRFEVEDRVQRALALCRSARLMGYPEFVEHLSYVRLGLQLREEGDGLAELELSEPVSPLLLRLAPAHLRHCSQGTGDGRQAAALRAGILRALLNP